MRVGPNQRASVIIRGNLDTDSYREKVMERQG